MVARLNCGDHFIMWKNVESLCCTPEANIILEVNYTSVKYVKLRYLYCYKMYTVYTVN